jgi:hypothetical protein
MYGTEVDALGVCLVVAIGRPICCVAGLVIDANGAACQGGYLAPDWCSDSKSNTVEIASTT